MKAVAALLASGGAGLAYSLGLPAWVTILASILIAPTVVYKIPNIPTP
jgi:hypothetical protein